jgi:hypothetical protein
MPYFSDPAYGFNQPQYTQPQLSGALGGMQQGGGVLGGSPSIWQRLLDPQTALPMAAAMIAGKTPQDSLAGAFAQAGPGLAATDQRLAINDWLKAGAPKDVQHPAVINLFKHAPALAQSYIGQTLAQQQPTADMQEYKFAQGQGFKGSFMDYQAQAKAKAASPVEGDQVAAISEAIVNGDQPPDLKGLYHMSGPVRADLAKRGFNFTKATEDWTATQKRLSVMNGPQQLRLRQAIGQVEETLPQIETLATQWQGGGFKPLNKATLAAAKQGLLGQDAQSLATRLDAMIADMTSELGTVYKGGNSSTDESLRLAAQNLQSDWSVQTLLDNVKQVKQQIAYRKNSMKLITAGTPDNRYDQPVGDVAPTPGAPAAAPAAPAAPGGVVKAEDYFK